MILKSYIYIIACFIKWESGEMKAEAYEEIRHLMNVIRIKIEYENELIINIYIIEY